MTVNENGDGRKLGAREMQRRLLALGLESEVTRRITRDEFSDETADISGNGELSDERVLPHPDGWLVTADVDTSDAALFDDLEDAMNCAITRLVDRDRSEVLVYEPDGRISRRIQFPKWR